MPEGIEISIKGAQSLALLTMAIGGVAFGANEGYLFFCGEHLWAAGLPVSLQKYFDDKKIKRIFQAALGPDGSYYMYYQDQAEKYQVGE